MLDFLRSFFNAQPVRAAALPFLHEAIDIKSYPVDDFQKWFPSGSCKRMNDIIRKGQSDLLITGKYVNSGFSVMKSSHANGFLISCRAYDFSDIDYKHFAYHIYTVINNLGYTLNLSEIKSQERGSNIESVTKYYLKPSLRNRFDHSGDSSLANQLYGNITIEYKAVNSIPDEFKFVVHAYQDSKYLEPKDYGTLLDALLAE